MPSKLSCIAIDDEPVALKIIGSLISKTPLLEAVGSFQDPVEGMNFIVENEPDIVFLDVQMPDISGMDLIKSLKKMPQIILVTSNSTYAQEAFDFQVTDFLLKPIKSYGRFMQAVQTAVENIKFNLGDKTLVDDSLFVKTESSLTKLKIDDIHVLEAYGDYVKVHTALGMHVVYTTLRRMEERLGQFKFIRVHRSFIVNISMVDKINPQDLEILGKSIPVSVKYKPHLLEGIEML